MMFALMAVTDLVPHSTVGKHLSAMVGAGFSWAVALVASLDAATQQLIGPDSWVPISVAVVALFSGIGLTWKAARWWESATSSQRENTDRIARLEDRIARLERKLDGGRRP